MIQSPTYLTLPFIASLNRISDQLSPPAILTSKQYHELQKPLYERRHAIITGATKPTEEEIQAGEQQSTKDDPDYTPLPKEKPESATTETSSSPAKGIPEFWLTALRNHVGLNDLITERDAEALKSLVDVRISYLSSDDPKPGFKLTFIFGPNDFFENEVLEKTYLYQEEVGYSGDFVYEKAIGTEIKWKDEKDLTKEFEIKKQRNKSTRRFLFSFHYTYNRGRRHEPYASCQEGSSCRLVLQLLFPTHSSRRGCFGDWRS